MTAIRSIPRTFLLCLVFVAALSVFYGTGVPSSGIAVAAASETGGVTVHGDWRIEVVNADGSIHRTLEVENALTGVGARQLARLVAGGLSSKGMFVSAVDSPLNLGVECPAGMRAYEGDCFPICTVEDRADSNNQICYEEPDAELCSGTVCPEGYSCYNGTCLQDLPDACDGVTCSEGYFCSGGACFKGCTEEEHADPDNYLCYTGPDACDGVTCSEGYFCSGGTCFQECTEEEAHDPDNFLCYTGPDPCDGVTCGPGNVCHGGTCYLVCTDEDFADPDNAFCYTGCDDVNCGDGEVCYGGACYLACTDEELADPDHVCYDGGSDTDVPEPEHPFAIDVAEATITLNRAVTRDEAWTIYGVESYLVCPVAQFTQKALDLPIEVAAGQTVNLTVIISFE